uniref:RING-type domain-containing protein n=1 Tax=Anopheles culicifacies TaxID=139723 RepID=A0A182MH46_9DIPT
MSDTKVVAESNTQNTDIQREETNRTVEVTAPPSIDETHVVRPISTIALEASPAATIVPTVISSTGEELTIVVANHEQQPSGGVAPPPPSGSSVASTQVRGPWTRSVERQTSVGSIDSTTMSVGAGSSSGNGPSSYRNPLSNGRMFNALISIERERVSSNHGASSRRGFSLGNFLVHDILTLLRLRHPGTLFSSERTGLFLNSERSHGPGTSTPPTMGNVANSDVVIDVDEGSGTTVAGSLRSSHNELYPISASSSSVNTNLRPFLWNQPGDENTPPANSSIGGRSPLMPNFNYNHHHHHFHNHQPLSLHHQQSSAGLSAATASMASPSPMSISGGEGAPSINGETSTNRGVFTPTTGNVPVIGAGGTTRSNSISSNHQNEDATVHEALNQLPESRALIELWGRYMSLVLILMFKLGYDHFYGIMTMLILLIMFYHANWAVRQEILKQKQRRAFVLLRELVIISILIFWIEIEWKSICLVIPLMPDHLQQQSLKGLLYTVCTADLALKLITIVIKIIVTLMPPRVVDYKSRGKVYLMIESLSQLYRAAAPIQLWIIFLFESYSGTEKAFGFTLTLVYIVAKSIDLHERFKFCRRSFVKLLQKTNYGNVPTKEQLQACGGQCSICHDNFNSPVLLECNHIFCELCVGTWFDREQTCPLCRAKIVDDPSYRDGTTTYFFQLY